MTIDIKALQAKEPLGELPVDVLKRLASCSEIKEYRQGDSILRIGDTDARHAFLLWGRVRLSSQDRKSRTIGHQEDSARFELAKLRPRQFDAVAELEGTSILWVDSEKLDAEVDAYRDSQLQSDEEIFITV